MKLKSKSYNFRHKHHGLVLLISFLSVFFFQLLFTRYVIDPEYYNEIGDDIGAITGIIIGTLISTFTISKFLINKKIRPLTIFILLWAYTLGFLFIFGGSTNPFFIFDFITHLDLSQSVENLITGIILGLCLIPLVQLFLHRHPGISISILFLFIFSLSISEVDLYSSNSVDSFGISKLIVIAIDLLFVLISYILLMQFAFQVRAKVLSLASISRFILFTVLIVFIASIFSGLIINYLGELELKTERIVAELAEERRRREQEQLPDRDLDFVNRITLEQKIIGLYQADSPQYLKIETFDINSDASGLDVIESNSAENYFINYRPSKQKPTEKEVQIIYATFGDYSGRATVPTISTFTNFENLILNDNGVLKAITGKYSPDSIATVTASYMYSDLENAFGQYVNRNYNNINTQTQNYDEITKLAKEVTNEFDSDLSKALALEKYFHENYKYSLSPGIADQTNPIDDFLFDTKQGYCTYFATSMTMMLESLDINARMVGGFYAPVYSVELDAYVLLTTNLHVWVEVWDDVRGWVKFDPTSPVLAEDFDMSEGGITGPGTPTDIDISYLLTAVNPVFSFEDIYNEADLGESIGSDNIAGLDETRELRHEQEETEREKLEQEREKQEEEERQKKLEAERKQREELAKTIFNIFVIFAILILIFVVTVVAVISYHDRQKYPRKYLRLRVRRRDTKIKELIQKHLLKKQPSHTQCSNKEFLADLVARDASSKISKKLTELFVLSDTILYSDQWGLEIETEYKLLWENTKQELNKLRKS